MYECDLVRFEVLVNIGPPTPPDQIARRPLESEHGDPFTLLNAYDEWIQVALLSGKV